MIKKVLTIPGGLVLNIVFKFEVKRKRLIRRRIIKKMSEKRKKVITHKILQLIILICATNIYEHTSNLDLIKKDSAKITLFVKRKSTKCI